MNKNLYKTIFSKTRGEMIAVAENVSAAGQASTNNNKTVELEADMSVSEKSLSLKVLSFSLMLITGTALISSPIETAQANVIADPNAAGNQRPTILNSANGTTQVNIQTPTQGGVSVNHYQQFDVNQNGVILNNSRQNTNTQLGGYIQGNPWLAGGEAKVIVNQVNSSNPSHLNGYVEVGGRKADVIIANQAGINVDGGGFINAGGVTLSTANPNLQNGQVTGYHVRDGQINITGNGLDSSKTDYTQILSRAASINAGIWANELTVVAGQNDIAGSPQVGTVQATSASTGVAPQVAIDTSHLGGMYAGKINLISTEKGVGINNAGQVFASAGNIKISANGEVLNSGAVVAQHKEDSQQASLEIKGTDLKNSGTLSSLGQQSLNTENIQNSGLITTSSELNIRNQQTIQNSGELNAGRIDIETATLLNQSGKIVQTGLQDLVIDARTLNNKNKGMIGYSEIEQDTGSGTGSGSGTGGAGNGSNSGSNSTAPSTATGGGSTSSANTSIATSFAQGQIKADQIENDAGKITANGGASLSLDTGLNNQNATLNLNTLNVTGTQFNNTEGEIYAQNSDVDVQSIDNTRGNFQVGKNSNLHSNELINQGGQIVAGTMLSISTGDINNQNGKLLSSQDVLVQAKNINNTEGQILANQDVDIQAKSVTADGELAAGHDLALSLKDSFTTQNKISAGNQLSINTAGDLTNTTELRAGNKLNLQAQTIENIATGRLIAENQTQISGENLINRGEINSNGQTLIEVSQQLNNIGTGKIYGNHVALAANELINQNEVVSGIDKAAVIAARQQLDIGAQQITNKEGALISSEGDMVIAGQLSSTKNAEGQAKTLNNNSAKIEAGNDLTITSQVIRNTNEHLKTEIKEVDRQHLIEYKAQGQNQRYAEGTQAELGWAVKNDEIDHLVTPDGQWHENWHKYDYDKITEQTQVVDSAPGQIIAGGNIKITGSSLLNSDSQILAGKTLVVSVDDLVNHETLGQTIVTDIGTLHSYYRERHKGKDSTGHNASSYRPAPIMTDLNLGVLAYQEHAQVQNNSGSTASLDISSSYQDGIRIRTGDVNTTLPNSSLFSINPNNGQYLIETDPSFTNYKKWLGSDYMLQMFNTDPQNMHKRLGDGYYEQKLVNDQIAKLTGQVYLDGYTNFEDQFKALMDSGVSAAKDMNLSVGVALSAEQVARLTNDIVWLVEQKITLADGSVETVLVPQVYVRLQAGDINGSGALLAGSNTALNVTNNLENSGTIAGRNALVIQADRIDNLGGRITANQLSAQASTDINNISGIIDAKQQLFLEAGRDINIVTKTNTTENEQGSNTHLNRQAGVYVTNTQGEGILSLQAGRDIQLNAGVISNASSEGVTQLDAKNNINLGTVSVAQRQENIRDENNYVKRSEFGEVGSQILANNDIQLKAGKDIQLRASEINSGQGNVIAQAQNIKVESGEYTKTADDATQSTSKGLLSSSTYTYKDSASNTQAVASVIGGKNIALQAEQDIGIKGSHVIADQDTVLTAKNNITIESAATSSTEDHFFSKEKSGLFSSGGIGFTVGEVKESTDNKNQRLSSNASTVGSLNGNTNIIAGKAYQQTGSTISAQQGDVNIVAQQVNIEAAAEQERNDYQYEREQKGFTLAVNVPVVSAIQTAVDATKQVGQSKNDRVNAMAAANAGFDAYKAGQSLAQLKDAATGAQNLADAANVSVSITYGEQKDTSFSHTESTTGASSQVYAGGKTNIIATGAGEQSNINIVGSDVLGKQGTTLIADNDINIKAFEQNSLEESGNKSQGFNVGVAVSYGGNGLAFGVTAGGNLGKGSGNGEETSYLNSHVGSQDSQTVINSGNAMNIIGGQVQGKGIQLTAKELNIESLQDKAKYEAKQQNISVQATVGYGASVSGSFSKSDIDANYASVNEQSGIYAGDDGYQIKVQNNTDLKGAIITSTQKAEDAGKNALSTGTLTASDIKNVSEYDAKGIGLSGSISVSGESLGQKAPSQEQGVVLNNEGNKGSGKSIGYGSDNESDSSVTKSGINTKNITITDEQGQQALTGKTAEQMKSEIYTNITTDNAKENSGALKNNFDKDKVQSEINLQVDVTKKFGENAPKAVADYAQQQAFKQRLLGNEEEAKKWDEGGIYRVAMHTALGALATGSLEGALTTSGIAVAAPQLNDIQKNVVQALTNQGMKKENAEAIINNVTSLALIGVGIGSGLNSSSIGSAVNVDSNNRQLHREEVDLIQNLAKEYAKEKGISLEEAETQLTRGALYHIDEGWKDAIDSKLDASDIKKYNQAYQYLLAQTKDTSVDEMNSNFYYKTDSNGKIVGTARIESYEGHISDSERQKADVYIGEAGKGFTATAEDFKNKDIFLTNTLAGSTNKGSADYNSKKEFIQNSAAIKDSETSFLERLNSSVDRDISGVKGAVTGVATEVKDTIVGVYEFLAHPIDNTKELINSTIEAAKNPVQTAKNVSEGMDQGLEKYNTTIDLYKMQKDEGAEAEYKANIAGQIVGAGGVGAAGKKGAEATVDAVKKAQQVAKEAEIAEALRKKQSVENNTNVDNNVLDDSIARENFWNDKTGGESPSLVRNPDVMNGLMQQNGIKFKDGVTKEDIFNIIYNTPAGKRPDPSVYLSPAYIKDWNDSWSEGAIRFTSKSQVAKHGTIGSNEAFVIPKTVFDSLYKESNGNLAYIERKLSLSDGYLSSNSTGAFWIKQQDRFKVQLPTGNEGGANVQWLPGGKTLNGTREGILDLKNSGLKFEEVSLGK